MKSVNEELRDRVIAHAHYLSRYENQQRDTLLRTLNQAHQDIIGKIAASGGDWSKAWLQSMLSQVDGVYASATKGMTETLESNLKRLSGSESEWINKVLNDSITVNIDVNLPSPAQVWAAVTTSPADRGHLMSELMDRYGKTTSDAITAAIRQGVVESESVNQMISRIRGTKAAGYTDGVMQTSRRGAETIVRTAVMHASNVAQQEVYKENQDIISGLQWMATLDDRTCLICGDLDGTEVETDSGTTPPLHFNCRCVLVPITKSYKDLGFKADDLPPGARDSMDGQVPGETTYSEWIKSQSEEVQDEVLGKGRAEILRKGGEISRFVNDGNPMSLDEIREAEGMDPAPVEFVEAKTVKEAEEWAKTANIADMVSYKGADVSVANDWNKSILNHVTAYPELRENLKFIGTTQERQRTFASMYADDMRKANQEYYQWMTSQGRQQEANERFLKQGRKEAGKTPGNTWAYANFDNYTRGISVNSKWASDIERFKESLESNVKVNWHPVGCNTVKSIVDHEMGHQLDVFLGINQNAEIRALYASVDIEKEVSRYARKNIQEFIAESWAEYQNNPTPRPIAKKIGEIIQREYKLKHGK